jgi:hypothetical protein
VSLGDLIPFFWSRSTRRMALLTLVPITLALLPGAPVLGGRTAVQPTSRAALVRCQEAAAEIAPPKLESACGFDFVPLLTALQSGEFREADQLTRDGLITLAGDAAVKRGYVYFTEVPSLPVEDMATIERLWQAYSEGKFGYSVQRAALNSKKVSGNLEKLFDRIGWKNKEGGLLRWLPEARGDEFIYTLGDAPKGHLPLTSTLRGQQLLQGLLSHPAWDGEGAHRPSVSSPPPPFARICQQKLPPPP